MIPLLALNAVNWKRVGVGAGVVILVGFIGGVAYEWIELRKARLAYEHPRVVAVTKTVRVQGPVVVKERIIREPGGREEITREEVRGPVVEGTDISSTSEPIFMPAPRPPRWIVGGSLADLRFSDRTAYTAWAGATLGGRLDLEGGLDGDFETTRLKVSWRF